MFTSYDKAIAAVIGGLAFVLAKAAGIDFLADLSADTIGAISAVLAGILVYFVPNKE